MPTGYTAQIKEGITFPQFAMICARAFGALVEMREDPLSKEIPEELKPSDYHEKALNKAIAELETIKNISISEATVFAHEERDKEACQHQKFVLGKKALKKAYQNMLHEVVNWNPPTPEHEGLQNFMIQQIKSSIEFDCYEVSEKKFVSLTGEQWIAKERERILHDICYHKNGYNEECKRTAERNIWIRELRESLKGY